MNCYVNLKLNKQLAYSVDSCPLSNCDLFIDTVGVSGYIYGGKSLDFSERQTGKDVEGS